MPVIGLELDGPDAIDLADVTHLKGIVMGLSSQPFLLAVDGDVLGYSKLHASMSPFIEGDRPSDVGIWSQLESTRVSSA